MFCGFVSFYFNKNNVTLPQIDTPSVTSSKRSENTTSLEKVDLQINLKIKHLEYFETLKQLSRAVTIGLILWTLPLLWILLFLKKEFLFWKELIYFF